MVVIKQAKRRRKNKVENNPVIEMLEKLRRYQEIPYALKCHEELRFDDRYIDIVKRNYINYSKDKDISSWNKHKEEIIVPYLKRYEQEKILKQLESM